MSDNGSDILKEPPIIFLPSLAVKIGLAEAIIVQKLQFFLSLPNCGREMDGRRWVFNTIEQWRECFPFWCEKTIRAAFKRMEAMHLVESCQPDGRMSRKKYYRINEGILVKLHKGSLPNPDAVKITGSKWKELPLPKHGVFHEDMTKESKETSFAKTRHISESESASPQPEYPATWKPIDGTKVEQLKRIRPPKDYPSEHEFDEFVSEEQLDHIGMGKRNNLYGDLCDNKWHHWNGRRWHRVTDWRAYITALDEKMEQATAR